ncbi:MAG: universal stress protein [Armatimonadetes bacterium]|nr:universal stress protein [Armatimonadota bacterium]
MIIEARDDTITLRGEVKSNLWPAIQAAAALLLENHPTGIILDGSTITKITPEGAETFSDAFAFIAAHNARIMMVGLTAEELEIGKTVPGVRSQLPIAATIEEARYSLQLGEATPHRGKAQTAGVVPMLGHWKRAVYLADKLAIGLNCEIHLVDLIKVPRTLPLGSPLPEREEDGQARLKEGQGLVRQTGLTSFTHVQRIRSGAELGEFAGRLNADFTLISIDHCRDDGLRMEQSEALALLEEAPLEVSIIKGSPANPVQPPVNVVVPATGAWNHAVRHACKLVDGEPNARVTLVSVIAIPRSQPLDTPKPDADAAVADYAKEAVRIGKRYGVVINSVLERVRDPVLGFLKIVEEGKFDLAVVGLKRETRGDYHISHSMALMLINKLPCEVMSIRQAR